jgi:hypothetical protein
MTTNEFLDDLCAFMKEATKNLRLPVRPTKEVREPIARAPEVYKMRLPDAKSYQDKAPYLINRVVLIEDHQNPGQRGKATCTVCTSFCVYSDDEMQGALYLLNVIEDVRQAILREQLISNLYQVVMDEGIQSAIYDNQPAPFFIGEMVSVWTIPTIEREVSKWLRK